MASISAPAPTSLVERMLDVGWFCRGHPSNVDQDLLFAALALSNIELQSHHPYAINSASPTSPPQTPPITSASIPSHLRTLTTLPYTKGLFSDPPPPTTTISTEAIQAARLEFIVPIFVAVIATAAYQHAQALNSSVIATAAYQHAQALNSSSSASTPQPLTPLDTAAATEAALRIHHFCFPTSPTSPTAGTAHHRPTLPSATSSVTSIPSLPPAIAETLLRQM